MTQSPERTGAIYDIGYRGYAGLRLGRRAALETLFWEGFRAAFGLGRRPLAKVAPWLLAAIALIPALVYLGVAAIIPGEISPTDIIKISDYLQVIFILLILFVAAVSPEIVCRDLRFRTLALYFTRPVERDDYAIARIGALTAATLVITVVPTLLLFVGTSLTADSAWGYLTDEWLQLPALLVSGLATALYASAVGIAIACHTHRRSYAMGGIVGFFIITAAIGAILAETISGSWALLDPGNQLLCFTLLLFNEEASQDTQIGQFDISLWGGTFVMVGCLTAAVAVIIRRYRKVSA